MLRRGYYDVLPEKVGLLQLRRRGYSDSKQFLPLQIRVPPTSTLCDIEGRFENPRRAPLPQGLKYNTMQTVAPQHPNSTSDCLSTPSIFGMSHLVDANLVEERTPEFSDYLQASIFARPKFNPETEMKKLQNLWKKRCSNGDPPPLICRSPQQSPESLQTPDPTQDRSFFESDSDSEDEEVSAKRFVDFLPTLLIVVNPGNVDVKVVVVHSQHCDVY